MTANHQRHERALGQGLAEDQFCGFIRQEHCAGVDIAESSVEML
jgi:hypothetical protein